MRNFTKKIRAYLDEHGMSQAQLADKLGMSAPTLSMYLHGNRTPTIEIVTIIERKLSMSEGYLAYDKQLVLNCTKHLPLLEYKDIDNFIKKGILLHDVIYLPIYFNSQKGRTMGDRCFYVKVHGDAMHSKNSNQVSINNGEFVAIDPDLGLSHGAKVLIDTGSDRKIREVVNDGKDTYYRAFDENFPVINGAEVIGRVFAKQTPID